MIQGLSVHPTRLSNSYSGQISTVSLTPLYFSYTPPLLLVQFSSIQSLSRVPMNHSTPGLPVHHQLLEFTQTHAHRVGDAIQPSHPLSSPSPPAPNPCQQHGLFQWVNFSHEVAKVLEFQLQHQSFQWTPRTANPGTFTSKVLTTCQHLCCCCPDLRHHCFLPRFLQLPLNCSPCFCPCYPIFFFFLQSSQNKPSKT